MTHDEARDAMPLFVVGADDPTTRAALLGHVEECETCRRELREHRLAADVIARAVPQVQPRPELRARTLAVTRDISTTPNTPTRAPVAWSGWLAAAATLVALVSLAGLMLTRSELVTHRRALAVMTADDLLQVSLTGVAPAGRAEATAFLSRSHRALVFTAHDLPALPADRVYQLWAIAGGSPISAGVFTPDDRGRGQLVVELPSLPERPAAMAVTVEPQGGVPSPTGPKYLLGTPTE